MLSEQYISISVSRISGDYLKSIKYEFVLMIFIRYMSIVEDGSKESEFYWKDTKYSS